MLIDEDLSGWDGEGVMINMSMKIYDKELAGKELKMVLKPKSIELKEQRK